MSIYIISYISTVIWFLVPFRQYKSVYFYFFVFLGLNDFTGFLFSQIFLISPQIVSVPIMLFLPFTLSRKLFEKFWVMIIISMVILSYPASILGNNHVLIINFLVDMIMLFYFLLLNSRNYFDKNLLNLFSIGLLFLEVSTLLKFLALIKAQEFGVIPYFITTFFQLIIGVGFLIFKESNPKLTLKLTKL